MDTEFTALLQRAVIALEKIAENVSASEDKSAREPQAEQTRKTLMQHFEGLYITIDQGREALGMNGSSAKAVSQIIAAAGFMRHRWASGIHYAICEPGGVCTGAPIALPDNLSESVDAARIAKKKHNKPMTAARVIYGAYLMKGVTAKPSQVTQAHIDEVKRLFPELDQ